MIRGVDDKGCLFVGLTRKDVERMIAGGRVCSNPHTTIAPGPHLCLFAAEDDEALLVLLAHYYPDTGSDMPTADLRGQPEYERHPGGKAP